ncbi:MAG TPA: helix-turn-helix transcriptional regulator [Spirochaetota bacterium]|nr:helix-turn-helix transcriptional regulator [Spirochaetota bacterium]HPJ37932.1 helix-turn-helix transcriptional regulator [Spirochaetota bacterium]HPQ54954.1 helix-turn-helix transcriptional regulator [Spirochaetota bacterium]
MPFTFIAEYLDISTETVKRHLANIFHKSGAKNRTELSHMDI